MKKILLALLILILLTVSGCQYKDINRRLFITELGVDAVKGSDMIELTAKAAIPSSGGGNPGQEVKQQIYTVQADSMGSALRILKSQTSLEPEYAHMKTILVGKDYTTSHPVNELLDFCIRRRDIQNVAYFVLAEPSAREIVNSPPADTNTPGAETFMKFGQGSESPYANSTKTYQIFRSFNSPGESPYCPIASIKEKKVVVDRVAVFSKPGSNLSGEFSPEETVIFKILTNTVKNPFIRITAADKMTYGINLNQTTTRFKLENNPDGKITCKVTIKSNATLEEITNPSMDRKELSSLFSEEINKRVTTFLNRLQDEGIDPLLLATKYWAVTPSYEITDDWQKLIFPTIKFDVVANVKIVNTGILE